MAGSKMVTAYELKYLKPRPMKSAWLWLNIYFFMSLNSGCAVAMGTRRSDCSINVPTRPEHELCISNGDQSLSCFDNRPNPHNYERPIKSGDVVININDYTEQNKWIKFLLDSIRGN